MDALSRLTGGPDKGEAPFAVGRKFDASGQPLECRGNTLLCHVDETSDGFRALSAAQNALKTCAYAQAFSFLPPRSFHITLAYLIHWLPEHAARDVQALADEIYVTYLSDCLFDLGPVEFCTFETMHHFEGQFFCDRRSVGAVGAHPFS